jgi:hypothetical protein
MAPDRYFSVAVRQRKKNEARDHDERSIDASLISAEQLSQRNGFFSALEPIAGSYRPIPHVYVYLNNPLRLLWRMALRASYAASRVRAPSIEAADPVAPVVGEVRQGTKVNASWEGSYSSPQHWRLRVLPLQYIL